MVNEIEAKIIITTTCYQIKVDSNPSHSYHYSINDLQFIKIIIYLILIIHICLNLWDLINSTLKKPDLNCKIIPIISTNNMTYGAPKSVQSSMFVSRKASYNAEMFTRAQKVREYRNMFPGTPKELAVTYLRNKLWGASLKYTYVSLKLLKFRCSQHKNILQSSHFFFRFYF